jgi:hypothetical protein
MDIEDVLAKIEGSNDKELEKNIKICGPFLNFVRLDSSET